MYRDRNCLVYGRLRSPITQNLPRAEMYRDRNLVYGRLRSPITQNLPRAEMYRDRNCLVYGRLRSPIYLVLLSSRARDVPGQKLSSLCRTKQTISTREKTKESKVAYLSLSLSVSLSLSLSLFLSLSPFLFFLFLFF